MTNFARTPPEHPNPPTLLAEAQSPSNDGADTPTAPVIVGGDINIHVEDAADADAALLAAVFVFDAIDLQQHVVGPTHNLGGTLDIVATFSGYRVDSLAVDQAGVISDHSLITCRLSAYHHVSPG